MKKVIAFDIGGTNTRIALINEHFELEKEEIVPTKLGDVNVFLSSLDELIAHFDLKDVVAFGVGIPGVCNRETGHIIDLPNVHIKDIPLGKHFREKYGLKTFVRNDAEVACLAEAILGAGKEYERVFFITISTGLGGAMVVDGENQDYITEIGHTAYIYKDHISEFEKLAGGTAGIPNLCEINGLGRLSAKEFFEKATSEDKKSKEVFSDWVNILNDFIHMIQNSYEPDIICVTGGVMKQKELFFNKLIDLNPDSYIVECKLKENAGIYGAGVYALKMMKII